MIVWALFDSGNGCYSNAAKEIEGIEIYSIGIDKENKNSHFINLDLADHNYIFGDKKMFETLDSLPIPDLIIASPPCESWSVASAMAEGNACWKRQSGDSLFEPQKPLSPFTVRDHSDYDNYQFKPRKSLLNRINGELCAFNTIEIIEKYNPRFYVIENPGSSKIFEYIERVLGFNLPFHNKTNYNNYDYPIKKPTKFASNFNLNLNTENKKADIEFKDFSKSYNERSNIPIKLVKEIFEKIKKELDRGI